MKKRMLGVLLLMLLIPMASASTLKGNVYDFSLSSVTAIVEINSTPRQKMVAYGRYSFQVEPGYYQLKARHVQDGSVVASTIENVTIQKDGNFTLDLILFPETDVNESLEFSEPGVQPSEFNYFETFNKSLPFLALFSILIIVWALHYSHKKYTERYQEEYWEKEDLELDEDASKILEFIDKEKRTTQKEIRNKFSYSQAKISLILTELEDKGLIKKIKRGRGNVIIRN